MSLHPRRCGGHGGLRTRSRRSKQATRKAWNLNSRNSIMSWMLWALYSLIQINPSVTESKLTSWSSVLCTPETLWLTSCATRSWTAKNSSGSLNCVFTLTMKPKSSRSSNAHGTTSSATSNKAWKTDWSSRHWPTGASWPSRRPWSSFWEARLPGLRAPERPSPWRTWPRISPCAAW